MIKAIHKDGSVTAAEFLSLSEYINKVFITGKKKKVDVNYHNCPAVVTAYSLTAGDDMQFKKVADAAMAAVDVIKKNPKVLDKETEVVVGAKEEKADADEGKVKVEVTIDTDAWKDSAKMVKPVKDSFTYLNDYFAALYQWEVSEGIRPKDEAIPFPFPTEAVQKSKKLSMEIQKTKPKLEDFETINEFFGAKEIWCKEHGQAFEPTLA